jgi:sugar phosphate isomerase/epimerase
MPASKNPFEDKGLKWPVIKINLTIKPLAERHFVTLAIISIIVGMLWMAKDDPQLWDVELFKTLLTAFSLTGFLNMVVSFHFAANQSDEDKVENTSKAFEAITETAKTAAAAGVDAKEAAATAAAQTAEAAHDKAEAIAGDIKK